ncbi:hypothetical protein [Stutzerimonas nitrititolerans]|uniref:hypothetical protein n=1 Tax=Stutzerimonas nitrititolerans TaxID=2482751 RepID=UPI0028B0C447|nr:hypothetical protein [Stutzerimonas nitrititolerans]
MNKPIHPAVAEHVMKENERLRGLLLSVLNTPRGTSGRIILEPDEEAAIRAALSQQAETAPAQDERWAVHAQGPDELYAAFSREDAEQHAAALNALSMPAGIQVSAIVVESPWPAAEHWKYLAEQERDHVAELRSRATRPAQTEQQPIRLPERKRTDHLPKEYKTMTVVRAGLEAYNRALDDVAALNAAPIAQTAPQPEQSGLVEAAGAVIRAADWWSANEDSPKSALAHFARATDALRAALSAQGESHE